MKQNLADPAGSGYSGSYGNDEALKHNHLKVQEQIESLPEEQRKSIRATQKAVDDEIAAMNGLVFNEARFEVDAFLAFHKISGGDRDLLVSTIKKTKLGTVFVFQGKSFIRTYADQVLSTSAYIGSLEEAVVTQVQFKEVPVKVYIKEVEAQNLTFWPLIKLAFKTLTKGNNNG